MFDYPVKPNPDYGKGCLRRHIDIHCHGNQVKAVLEDDAHALQIQMEHDDLKVTDIAATWYRHPTSTCSGSAEAIKKLIDCPLTGNVLAPREYQPSNLHCTHLFDLSGILMAQAYRLKRSQQASSMTRYRAVVTDAVDGYHFATLVKNDEQVLKLEICNKRIQSPGKYYGVPAVKGLTSWAVKNLDEQELEYAMILQKAMFISISRRFVQHGGAGQRSVDVGVVAHSCYAMQEPRLQASIKLASAKSYSDTPELMLKFVE